MKEGKTKQNSLAAAKCLAGSLNLHTAKLFIVYKTEQTIFKCTALNQTLICSGISSKSVFCGFKVHVHGFVHVWLPAWWCRLQQYSSVV